jgi:fluoride exporter
MKSGAAPSPGHKWPGPGAIKQGQFPFTLLTDRTTMTKLFLVGLGGFMGSIARFLLSTWVQEATGTNRFPYGTLAVNLVGCLLIGLLFHWPPFHKTIDLELRLLLITGLLGGFTTFSAFGNETLRLIQADQPLQAGIYAAASLLLGVGAVWLGQWLAQTLH